MISNQESIDDQLGRAISTGLKKCRTLHMGSIPSSALLTELRNINRFWLVLYNKKVGKKISNTLIRRLSKKVNITNYASIPIDEIKYKLSESKRRYKSFVHHAPDERMKQLEELASVYASEGLKSKSSALKQIMNTESSRNQAHITRAFFPKKLISSRVDKVQYCQGSTIRETNKPKDLVRVLQNENKDKYSCTNSTPLMQPDLHSKLGNFAETSYAQALLHRTQPLPPSLSKWTKIMIQKAQYRPDIPKLPPTMTSDEVKTTWRATKENKATPMSGRYNAVYKALCMRPHSLSVLTNTMNLPFKTGHPYNRWKNMLDIMTFKSSSSIMVNSLRSIIIAEADWNASGRTHITKRMMSQAENLNLLPNEHIGGRKGKKSIEGAIAKRLIIENTRLQRRPLVILSTDAANCYDRIIHKYVSMVCNKWGISTPVMKALLEPLQKARHFTRTAYGDSDTFFSGTNLQGAGQGNTGAAPFWTCESTSMIEVLKDHGFNASFITSFLKEIITIALIAFVDDTEIFLSVPNDSIPDLIELADRTLNTWREVLAVTGGAMRAKKCGWTLLTYDSKGKLRTKNPYKADLFIPEEDGTIKMIGRYDPTSPRQYLGVLQTADSNDSFQLDKMYKDVLTWNQQIAASKMLPLFNLQALLNRIHRTLAYPLPALTLSKEKLEKLSNKLSSNSIHKCNICRTFPIDFRYLPHKYHGLNLPDLYLEQHMGQIKELISHSTSQGVLGQQIRLSLESIQMELGVNDLFFNYPYNVYNHLLITPSWMTSIWRFLRTQGLNIHGWSHKLSPTRKNDLSIMEEFVKKGLCKDTLITLNKCRLYLQVHSLADITNAKGTSITNAALSGKLDTDRKSTFSWRKVRKPILRDWYIWKESLHSTFCVTDSHSALLQPLGEWISSPNQQWTWRYDNETRTLYKNIDNLIRVYTPTTASSSTRLRSNLQWFKARYTLPTHQCTLPQNCASIGSTDRGQYMAALESWYPQPISSPIPPLPNNLYQQLLHEKTPLWLIQHQKEYLSNIPTSSLNHLFDQPSRAVSDGSFKDNIGAAAAIIESVDQKASIISTCPVPINTKKDGDAYRTELAGILLNLHIIQASEILLQSTGSFIVSCDNDEALNKSQFTNLINTSFQHFDLLKSIQHITSKIKSKVTYQHVLGHAKDKVKRKLTRAEILNDYCDELANTARTSLPPSSPTSSSLLGEGLSLWQDTTKFYKNFEAQIRNLYFQKKAPPIVCAKIGISKTQFHSISWDSLSEATSLMPPMKNIYIAKHVAGFLPIGRNMVRRGAWKAPHCPRCPYPIENSDHIIKCPNPASRKIFRSSMTSFNDWLESTDTPSTLITQILEVTASWVNGSILLPHKAYSYPILQQLQLGWDHFMVGRLHVSFIPFMTNHYTSIASKRSPHTWAAVLIQKLWSIFHFPQWENRNKYVHNLDKITDSSRERKDLLDALKTSYTSEKCVDLLSQDRHLLEQPLPTLKKLPNALIRAWLEEFNVAQQSRDRIFSSEITAQATSLRSFLLPVPKPCSTTNPCDHAPQSSLISQPPLPTAIIMPPPKFPPIRPKPNINKPIPYRKRKSHPKPNKPHKQTKSNKSASHPKSKTTTTYILRLPSIPSHMSLYPNPFSPNTKNDSTSPTIPTEHIHMLTPSTSHPCPLLDIWATKGTKKDLLMGSWRPP